MTINAKKLEAAKRYVAHAAGRSKRPAATLPIKSPPKAPPPEDAPYWIPRDSGWDMMSDATRQAVTQVLTPAYRQLVLEAGGELERSVGVTLVHLMWLEICTQMPLGLALADVTSVFAVVNYPDSMIARHLNLVGAKCQTAELLTKVQMVGEMLRREAAAAPLPLALPAPEGGELGA